MVAQGMIAGQTVPRAVTDDRAQAAFDEGSRQWPALRGLTLGAFRAFVDEVAVEPEALDQHAGDFYLAAAAVAGDADAVKLFDERILADLPRWLARLRLQPATIDDIGQQLRAKLLVGPEPRLRQYRGKGPLGAWVRVAAMRVALDVCGGDPVFSDRLPAPDGPLLGALSPEQQLIRDEYGTLFEQALRDALAQLAKRDRNLLRLHYVSRMSLDAIARAYRVHRATVVRWLAAVRSDLDTVVRVRLWQELGVSPSEFRSLWNAVRSNVEVSLSHLLAVE